MSDRGGLLPRMFKIIAGFVIFVFLLTVALAGYWYLGPYRGFTAETFVEVEHGMSSRAIANRLASRGVVRSPWAFLAARALHPRATLQAGEYRFGSEASPLQVFDKIRKGEVFYEELTFPEGSNIFDIAGVLKNSDTVKPDDFLKAAADPESIRDLDP
ncbi:MAG: endolytic transglycosylase MltG, partial [Bryobacteraceae bacterium]